MQFQFTHTGCSGRASLLPQKRVIRVAEVRLHWSEMKSLFHPTPDCSIHLWHPERWCTGVRRVLLCPFLQHQGQGFNDLTSLLRPKKGLSLLAAWLVLKAESCKAKISEGIQRGLTTGDTCYYTHMSARWRSPQEPKVGEHPTLPLTRTACSWSLRQILSVVFLVRALYSWPPPGTRMNPPRGDKRATRNLELVFQNRIALLPCFLPQNRAHGVSYFWKGQGWIHEALQGVGVFVTWHKR